MLAMMVYIWKFAIRAIQIEVIKTGRMDGMVICSRLCQ